MENTEGVFFEDDRPIWYIAVGDNWIGPMAAVDVYEKVLGREISWGHFAWTKGQSAWKRICDIDIFQAALPGTPSQKSLTEIKKSSGDKKKAKASEAPKSTKWFLYYKNSQYGPFQFEEVSRFIQIGKVHGKVFGWRDGMGNWTALEKIAEFKSVLSENADAYEKRKKQKKAESKKAAPAIEEAEPENTDQRIHPRRPLVARVMLTDQKSLMVGMCRDISVGGMQVLTDDIPGPVGTNIRLNISSSGDESSISSFVAHGELVRILEDGRGFSFRFDNLTSEAKDIIAKYIQNA